MALPSSLGRLPSYNNAAGAGGFEKLQNSPFGSGSLTAGLSQRIQQSGGLGDTRAIPVGRSTMDPERAFGMMSRGTARPGQVQAALGMENLQRQRRQDARAEQAFGREQQYYDRMEEAVKKLTEEETGGSSEGVDPGFTPSSAGNQTTPPMTGNTNPPPPTAAGGANAASPTTAGASNPLLDAYGKIMFGGRSFNKTDRGTLTYPNPFSS